MIAVIGEPYVTLKRIMVDEGFVHLSDVTTRGRSATQDLNGVFNCSYPPSQMYERVYRRWSWISSDLPIINKNLITNKLEAQRKMEGNGLEEHILSHCTTDLCSHNDEWVVKPHASQGGVGIRGYEGGQLRSGFYLQRRVNKLREFRAHVGLWLNNPVFTIQEKKPKPEMWQEVLSDSPYQWPATQYHRERLPLTWNVESGFYFRRNSTLEDREEKLSRFPLFRRIEELAIKAVKTLEYQFGAVDILMDEDRNLWVVEINSHPAIKNEMSKVLYAEALAPLKTISKMDLFSLTQQTTSGTVQRVMTRR